MTAPPNCFSAHNCSSSVSGQFQQSIDAGAKIVRHHVVSVPAKSLVTPGSVYRIWLWPASATQFWKMFILHSGFSQRVGEVRPSELWITSRTRELPHVRDSLDSVRFQQFDKIMDTVGRVPNGPDSHDSPRSRAHPVNRAIRSSRANGHPGK